MACTAASAAASAAGLAFAEDQKVAAGHALDRAEDVLAGEFAVHDRQPPVTPAFELLAELKAVAEETQVAADLDVLVLDDRQAVVAGGGGAGEDALADAIDDRLLQGVAAEGEQQQADAGPAVGRLVRRQDALDAGLGVAADDRGGVAGGYRARRSCAQAGVSAVTMNRAAVIGKASAKVSSMGMLLMVSKTQTRSQLTAISAGGGYM